MRTNIIGLSFFLIVAIVLPIAERSGAVAFDGTKTRSATLIDSIAFVDKNYVPPSSERSKVFLDKQKQKKATQGFNPWTDKKDR